MPLYDYRCLSCNKKFEKLVSSSKTKVKCPFCQKGSVERLMSSFGFTSDSGRVGIGTSSSCGGCTATTCKTCKG